MNNFLLGNLGQALNGGFFQKRSTWNEMARALNTITYNAAPTITTGTTSANFVIRDTASKVVAKQNKLNNLAWLDRRVDEMRVAL